MGKLFQNLDSLPKEISTAVRNNGGRAYNHKFFFEIMTPNKSQPTGELKKAIEKDFGSDDKFVEGFKKAAKDVFASVWA